MLFRSIAASGAKICFVALGAPKQEFFASTATCEVDGVVWLGVGAALDFIAGHRRRAPRIMQRTGLEWLWRVAQEPRRMLPRYVRSALWLAGYLLRLLIGHAHHDGGAPVEVNVALRKEPAERALPIHATTREIRR